MTVELTPTEALTLAGIVQRHIDHREVRGRSADTSHDIANKIDRAIHDALEAEQPKEAVR